MKTLLTKPALAALLLLCVPALVRAQPAAAAPAVASAADADFAAFQALRKATPPAPPQEMGRQGFAEWVESAQQKIIAAGLAFYEAHPTDPRRWEVVQAVTALNPQFVKAYGPNFATQGMKDVVVDEAAKAAWWAKVAALKQAMAGATDVPEGPREEMDWTAFAKDFRAATAAMRAGQPVDWAAFRPRFDAHAAKYPAMDAMLVRRANDYLGALEKSVPGSAAAEWAHVQATTANAALRTAADEQLRKFELMSKPLDLAFTAVDGRAVDLKDLRGKVVLIDFWATWCGPCIAELPNVKKVYAAYHDRGFEIVGITLENARLTANDTAEQAAAKLAAARKVLTDFTAKEEMPWPQHFDGKFWKNDISTRFGIAGIPAMFLLDQQGRIVTTEARGPKLEAEVKRLLGL